MGKFDNSVLNEYARQNAKDYIYEKEAVLEPDYPIHAGYAYVAVYECGEVKIVSSWLRGRAVDLIADINKRDRVGKTPCVELRRCELVARMLAASESAEE